MLTPIADRFWPKVDVRGQNECWPWTAGRYKNGYGAIGEGGRGGRHLLSHRVSWEIHRGSIPAGLIVCHTCDNPQCVNPGHLFLSTHKGNAEDRDQKLRGNQGERNHFARLTSEQVAEIRRLREQGMPQREVADRFGIHRNHVNRIFRHRRWATVV